MNDRQKPSTFSLPGHWPPKYYKNKSKFENSREEGEFTQVAIMLRYCLLLLLLLTACPTAAIDNGS